MRLTAKDLRLLYEMSENARSPYSQIGKRIRMSQQMVSYKVNSWLDGGLVQGFYPLVDYAKLSLLSFRVFFKANYASRERFFSLIETISRHPGVTEVMECGGKYDMIVVFSDRNPSSFNKSLKQLIYEEKDLKDSMILTTVVIHNFPRKYLVNLKTNKKVQIVGGDRAPVPLDNVDIRLLRELQAQPTASSVALSSAMNLNPKTIISRMRRMEELEVIRGYRPLLGLQDAGFHVNKIFLTLHHLSKEREDELIRFCRAQPNVTTLIRLFGGWDMELTAETRSTEEFRAVYTLLREEFQDIIKESEHFPVFRTHKKQFLPQGFFQ